MRQPNERCYLTLVMVAATIIAREDQRPDPVPVGRCSAPAQNGDEVELCPRTNRIVLCGDLVFCKMSVVSDDLNERNCNVHDDDDDADDDGCQF